MSVQPGKYNFNLQRRADFSFELTFKRGDPLDGLSGVDLVDATILAQVWNQDRTQKYADFNVEYLDRNEGKVRLSLTDTQTATFLDTMYYDVLFVSTINFREYFLEGQIYVSEGYTA